MNYKIIAHDLGTSGNKASLFSVNGELVRSATIPYAVHYLPGNGTEQAPRDWWDAVCKSTRIIMEGIDKKEVLAISFSAQMQCCLPVDRNGMVLHPGIIWADQRAAAQTERLKAALGDQESYELLGHRLSPSYSIEKLMWLKDVKPDIYQKTYKMLQVKDYVLYRMTGRFVTDYSDASGTNALDLRNLCWSRDVLRAAGISEGIFPQLCSSTDVIGNLTKEAAEQLGLNRQTSVVCGGGDGPCSALGAGCIEENQMFMSFGTSAWIGGTTREVFLDESRILFCFAHVIPGYYMPCGTMQSAGSAYSYIKDTFCRGEIEAAKQKNCSVYEIMDRLAGDSPPGAKGLLFLPYLNGERSPRWNPAASGSFLRIHMQHKKEDYIRAVLEGVAMNLDLILKAYRRYLPVEQMILIGGGAKGRELTRILSDVLQVSLIRSNHVEEATSMAAAVIGGIGVGVYRDFSAIKNFIQFQQPVEPDGKLAKMYDDMKVLFDKAYYALESIL